MSRREEAFGGFAMGRNDKKASIASKIKKSIFSGVNALSNMFGFSSASAETAGTGGFTTTDPVGLSNQSGAGMIRRGSGAAPPVSVTANSGNTTSSVTTVLSGGNGLNTIDASLAFIGSVGPMSNLERARMR